MKIKYICTTTVRLLPLLHSTTSTTIVTRSRVTAAVGASGKGQHAEHKPNDVLVCSKTTGTSPRRLPTNYSCVTVLFTRTKPPGINRLFANTNSFAFTSIFFVKTIMAHHVQPRGGCGRSPYTTLFLRARLHAVRGHYVRQRAEGEAVGHARI